MEQIGHVLKLMHSFDDAGFQEFSEPKHEDKHEHKCSAGNKWYCSDLKNQKREFKMMDDTNQAAHDFFIK